jgi:hypothetical protein
MRRFPFFVTPEIMTAAIVAIATPEHKILIAVTFRSTMIDDDFKITGTPVRFTLQTRDDSVNDGETLTSQFR